jgi:hypothetical protein
MSRYHSPDCANAETHRCRCWCGGEFHGITTGIEARIKGEKIKQHEDPEEIFVTEEMGGEVAEAYRQFFNIEFQCLGTCNRPIRANPLRADPHPDGRLDRDGKKWWLYVTCEHCQYQTALWKIPNRIKVLEAEKLQSTMLAGEGRI